jgi:hypothetical protein
MSRGGGIEFADSGRLVIWHQKCSEQKQLAFHITFEAWNICQKFDSLNWLELYGRVATEAGNRQFRELPKVASFISSVRQILCSFTSGSSGRIFPPQEEILHNHFTSKFSLDLVSMTAFRSILHFPIKFQAAAAASQTTADIQEIQQEVSVIIFNANLTFSEPCIMMLIRKQDQQDKHLFLKIFIN